MPPQDDPMPMPMSPPAHDGGGMMAAMHMSFFWGKDVVVLLAGWPGSGRLGMYVLALAVVFLLAVAAEVLSVVPRLKPREISPAAGALVHAAVYGVRMGLAYLVMLAVMSFNIGIFIAAVAGHALGCFLIKFRALTAVARAAEYSP
ncbi:copper transporter 2-like [Andrographis paniculata]|uniref:copper transporter 2-like n=1 Tax=Andrographis paniculata TaxID=175694 RepID=UPI0021E71073|nr:copper transporter 2-like [Andrographis paniculata]